MGGGRWYYRKPGHTENMYETVLDENGNPVVATVGGVKGCLIKLKTDPTGNHTSLPSYSRTSDLYFRKDPNGEIVQASLYLCGKKVLDFDWGHYHTNVNGNKKTLPKGVVHVQFHEGKGVKYLSRGRNESIDARFMTKAEIAKYGPILKYFCPNIDLGPNAKKKS